MASKRFEPSAADDHVERQIGRLTRRVPGVHTDAVVIGIGHDFASGWNGGAATINVGKRSDGITGLQVSVKDHVVVAHSLPAPRGPADAVCDTPRRIYS